LRLKTPQNKRRENGKRQKNEKPIEPVKTKQKTDQNILERY
jgi:hypothetical protein